MDTPYPIRGNLYNTHTIKRCNTFKKCVLCKMCANYNPNHLQCTLCESGKPDNLRCKCTERSRQSVRDLERVMKRPMFDPNPDSKDLQSLAGTEVAFNKEWDETREGLQEGIAKLSEVDEETGSTSEVDIRNL